MHVLAADALIDPQITIRCETTLQKKDSRYLPLMQQDTFYRDSTRRVIAGYTGAPLREKGPGHFHRTKVLLLNQPRQHATISVFILLHKVCNYIIHRLLILRRKVVGMRETKIYLT